MRPFEELLEWCLEALGEERAQAHEESEGMEPRSCAFRWSQAESESPGMRRFLVDLPGVRRESGVESLPLEAAWLGFRILRAALLASACVSRVEESREDLGDRLMLLTGLVLDPVGFRSLLVSEGEPLPPRDLVERLGGRTELARLLEKLLQDRTRPLLRLPRASAGRGSFEYLTVAAAAEAALALFDDRVLRPEEMEALEKALSARGTAVLRLLTMAGRADGRMDKDEDRAIRVIGECLGIEEEESDSPDPTAEDLRRLFPTEEERAGLVSGLATVIAADGEVDRREELMCRVVASALGLSAARVDELLERARRAAAG